MKLSAIKPEKIYLSSWLVNAKPSYPYASADELATIIKGQIGLPVVKGRHDYH